MQERTDVAALVVHYDSPDTLKQTVGNLSQFFPPERLFVVDNSSSLADSEVGLHATIIDDGENYGYAGGVNVGIRHISSISAVREVLVCTHETLFRENAVELLLETASQHPGDHIVAPRLMTKSYDGADSIWSNGGTLSFPFFYPKHNRSRSRSGVRKAVWVDGAAFVIGVSTWHRVGGVPEEFFMYMEDVALGLQCQKLGIPVLTNLEAEVEQTANGPSRTLAIRNRAILAMRYMGSIRRMVVLGEINLRSLLMAVHTDPIVKSKSRESKAAVREAKSIVDALKQADSSRPSIDLNY
ncbi:hypothetical protein ACIPYV_00760 [Paenarthrobacter nicotinovorans]|uniref:hypothetical protein n=1 Tax=Paenarthrobacter nicotinovorans TaxID=29320 RepID=UPI00380349E7